MDSEAAQLLMVGLQVVSSAGVLAVLGWLWRWGRFHGEVQTRLDWHEQEFHHVRNELGHVRTSADQAHQRIDGLRNGRHHHPVTE